MTKRHQRKILELKTTKDDIKNSLEGFNNKFEKAGERIRKLQKKLIESIQLKELKRKRLKKQSLREL